MSHNFELVETMDGVRHWRHRGNHLNLLCWPTPVAPVASFGIVYLVGSRHELGGHTGATHFLEHLMFKGSERFNREHDSEIARVLQRVGANFNATTWLDRTNYYETLPVEELELAVTIEADRMRGALLRAEDVASERTVILNELERGENEPFELLMKSSFAHAFVEHPYHHPTIGWRGDVEQVEGAVLRRFYDTYYHPDNAWVLVVGEVEEAAVLAMVERRFGAIPPAAGGFPQPTIREGRQRGQRRFELPRAGETAAVALSWHVPEALHPDIASLSVLTQVLSDGVTSRLHQKLVEPNLCLGVHAFVFELHDPGLFQILATVAPGRDPAEVEEIIRAEVAGLAAGRPTAAEVARAKVQTRTDLAFHRESPAHIVAALTESVAAGDWRHFLREMDAVAAVSAEDLQRVAAAYLRDDGITVGTFLPEGPGGSPSPRPPAPTPCFLHRPFAERVELVELPGGTRVAVLDNPHAPTVTIAGSLRAGPAMAPDGRFTVPALTAAMLDRGTSALSRLELAAELEDHGLQLGVQASSSAPTVVTLGIQGLADELDRMLRLLVEVLRRPSFPADELTRLKERVTGSLVREREETSAQAFAALARHLYPPGHPRHRRTVDERLAEVAALDGDDLRAFYELRYGPGSLTLAVVGSVAAAEVVARLGELMASWQGGSRTLPELPELAPHPPAEELIHIADRPNLDVYLGHRGELLHGDPDEAAAILANACLGQSTLTSRLGVEVRDRAGLTYGIYSRFFGTLHLPGPWATALSVSPANLQRAVTLCREVIGEYVQQGPGEEELADERRAAAGAYRVGLATNSGVARELVSLLAAGADIGRLDRYPAELLATTREEVMAALARHLHPEQLVLTVAGSLQT